MEELRLRGNALFPIDPQAAAAAYQEALCLYNTLDNKIGLLEEYTKCAGNALTCLFKLQDYEACAALAHEVLNVNPLIAKAYAFIGRCCLFLCSTTTLPRRKEEPLQYLCRALYLLPSMCQSTMPFIAEALDRLLEEKNEQQDEEPSVEVRQGECGNCVVATSRLPPMLPVSSTLHPFSVCAYEETEGRGVCAHCGLVTIHDNDDGMTQVRLCGKCHLVAYCSDDCALRHTPQHEAHECRFFLRLREMQAAMQSCGGEVPDDFFTVAAHCIATLSGLKVCKAGHKAVLQLQSHAAEVSQGLAPLVRLVQDVLNDEDPALVARLVGTVRCNALAVCDVSGLAVGQALHAANITSYFNHSCVPNCAIQDDAIVTTRVIAPGEELTVAYLPQLYWPAWLRREELGDRYFFECRCVRCVRGVNGGSGGGDPFESALSATVRPGSREKEREYIASVQLLCSQVRAKAVGDVGVDDRDALLRLLRECRQQLFPFHYLCHELRNTLSFVYSVLGDTRACLRSCLAELLLWESIVPGAHPVKRLKVQNALRCCVGGVDVDDQGISDDDASLLLLRPLLEKFSALYDVDG